MDVATVVVDGCTTVVMEAFACMRVKIVSTGWMARVEIPPEIQPAVKSIQDASLDMFLLMVLCKYKCFVVFAWLWLSMDGRNRPSTTARATSYFFIKSDIKSLEFISCRCRAVFLSAA